MKTFNVCLASSVEWEVQIEAEDEDEAQGIAITEAIKSDVANALRDADFYSTTTPEAVSVWEVEEEKFE